MLKKEASHKNLQILSCSAYVERNKLRGVYSVKINSHRCHPCRSELDSNFWLPQSF